MKFTPFPKIPRLFRDIIITEKLDGTNASIFITGANDTSIEGLPDQFQDEYALAFSEDYGLKELNGAAIYAGSRNRWINEKNDNYGFAKFVKENAAKLFLLGHGHHFGEWWGQGIQRNYGLNEKRFSLFNTHRWGEHHIADGFTDLTGCYTVPKLYEGLFAIQVSEPDEEPLHDPRAIDEALSRLMNEGSIAAPGFMKPEGIIVYHKAGDSLFKVLLENDDKPKTLVEK